MTLDLKAFVAVGDSVELSREQELRNMLNSRAFDYENRPQKPSSVLQLGDKVICTPGNITNVQAPPKAGKTALVSGIIGACCASNHTAFDTLGFHADNSECKSVIHFDTEQSRYDSDAVVRQGLSRAGIAEPPPYFESYSVADLSVRQRYEVLFCAIENKAENHPGIRIIIIDGVADICSDPNNAEDCFALVDKLHATAIIYDCVILTVIHENPGSVDGKTRGHLGSQLERKAETNLRLAKDASGITTVWCERGRHCHIPRIDGFHFKWSEESGMHVSVVNSGLTMADKKILKYQDELMKVFEHSKALTYAKLVAAIMKVCLVKDSAAKKRVAAYCGAFLVKKVPHDGGYALNYDQKINAQLELFNRT